MPRTVPEWIGKTLNATIPARVKLRIFDAQGGKCAITGARLVVGKFQFDHTIALINGGQNRESNIQCIATAAHKPKTKDDVAEKAKLATKRGKGLGIIRPAGKIKSAGFAATAKPERATGKAGALPRRSMFKIM
jgi:5-methylcytosine-specific restriction enzyme A